MSRFKIGQKVKVLGPQKNQPEDHDPWDTAFDHLIGTTQTIYSIPLGGMIKLGENGDVYVYRYEIEPIPENDWDE